MCAPSARAKGQSDDSNLQYYASVQPGAQTLMIKAKLTLWTIRIFA